MGFGKILYFKNDFSIGNDILGILHRIQRQISSHHVVDQIAFCQALVIVQGSHILSVAHDCNPIGNPHNLFQPMGYVDNGHSLGFQTLQNLH